MLTEQEIKGKWSEFKSGIRNLWGKLSDEDIERTKGNFSKISALVQSRYGESKEGIRKKFDQLLASFDNETDKHPQDIGSSSYQRNPTAEPEEQNFSVGNEYDSKEIYEGKEEDRIARH